EMLHDIGVQGPKDAQVVRQVAQPRKDLANQEARFAARRELERRGDEIEALVGFIAERAAEDAFAGIGPKFGFVIEGINVRETAGEEDKDEVLGLGREVRRLGSKRTAAVQIRCER